MTDKEQIIIDGVDVSECLFYQVNFEEDYDVKIKHFCSNWHNSCESINNSNCYFKQLARKTQECEQLQEYKLKSQLDFEAQQKALDEYKQSLDEKNKFLQDLGISANGEFKRIKFYIENLKNKYNKKTEECEELISEKDFYLQKIAVLEQECEELKEQLQANQPTGICETCMAEAILQNDKYRKALEEIEGIVTKDYYDNNWADITIKIDSIRNIVNKAKGKE